MYRVIEYFTDLQDNDRPYNVGDTFPRDGLKVSANRIKELSTTANLRGVALIEEVRDADETIISKTETVDNSAAVEDEPRKRTRKRKTTE